MTLIGFMNSAIQKNIVAIIPARDYPGKKRPRTHTLHRKKGMILFKKKICNRCETVESVISAFKRKFGSGLSSVGFSAQRAELYCRTITHNVIFLFIIEILNGTGNRAPLKISDSVKKLFG